MPRDALANPVVLAVLGALLERPMHPYQLAGVLGERGVPVNRGSLYDTVEAMARAGWLVPQPSEQAGGRPQRTPYAITGRGQAELASRLGQQIRTPRREFPEFFGAVSHLGVLGPVGAASALRERAEQLAVLIAEDEAHLAAALATGQVPRLFVIEAEYALHMARAERAWVLALIEQIETGALSWPPASPPPRPAGRRRQAP
jgi:DNA-binding PadR family transcriptional regulator